MMMKKQKRVTKLISLLLLMAFGMTLFVSCGAKADRSGEWGAYYAAFEAFSDGIKKNTRFLCVDGNEVEGNNYPKLYDLFYEYCKGKSMRLLEGGWAQLYQEHLLTNDGKFTDGYLLTFSSFVWIRLLSSISFWISP